MQLNKHALPCSKSLSKHYENLKNIVDINKVNTNNFFFVSLPLFLLLFRFLYLENIATRNSKAEIKTLIEK